MTPLQLGAMVSAIAKGGTLYYLQHPANPGRNRQLPAASKAPAGHRSLDSRLSDGMAGAYSTAQHASCDVNFNEEEILGNTGRARTKVLAIAGLPLMPTPVWDGWLVDLPAGRASDLRAQSSGDRGDACIATCTITNSLWPVRLRTRPRSDGQYHAVTVPNLFYSRAALAAIFIFACVRGM